MPKMLTGNNQKGWPHIQRLLVDLFQFMEPFLRNAELGASVSLFNCCRFVLTIIWFSHILFNYIFVFGMYVGSFSV